MFNIVATFIRNGNRARQVASASNATNAQTTMASMARRIQASGAKAISVEVQPNVVGRRAKDAWESLRAAGVTSIQVP
jgi:hypothetical protein